MVLFAILDHLFRLDFTPAKALVFDNLLWILLLAAVVVFFIPDKWKWHCGGLLAIGVLLASMDLSFFIGILSWNFFIIGAVLTVAATKDNKDIFWPVFLTLLMLCAFGPLLELLGWAFMSEWFLYFVLCFVIYFLFDKTRWFKALDPYLFNLIILIMSWYFLFHW